MRILSSPTELPLPVLHVVLDLILDLLQLLRVRVLLLLRLVLGLGAERRRPVLV